MVAWDCFGEVGGAAALLVNHGLGVCPNLWHVTYADPPGISGGVQTRQACRHRAMQKTTLPPSHVKVVVTR